MMLSNIAINAISCFKFVLMIVSFCMLSCTQSEQDYFSQKGCITKVQTDITNLGNYKFTVTCKYSFEGKIYTGVKRHVAIDGLNEADSVWIKVNKHLPSEFKILKEVRRKGRKNSVIILRAEK